MGFKNTPPALHLAWDMGEWLTIQEITAMAAAWGVALDNTENPSSAAFELVLAIRNNSLQVARLETMARKIIAERMHK